jgi:PAS domain S-box-containing protein/diguanylate cyclase (GGDEF)-like protein
LPIKNDTKSNIGYLISRVKNSILSEFEYQFKVNFIVSTLFVIFFILAFILFNRSRVQTLQQKAILEQRFQKSSEELKLLDDYKKAVDISNVVSKSDIEGNITYVNDRFCEISGYTKEELIGKNFRILRHEETPIEVFKDLWDTILNKKVWKGIVKNKKKNGDFYVVDVTIIPILDKKLNIQEFMTIRSDITELIIKEEKIKNQTTDSLTLLPNRVKLLEDIENSNLPSISIVNIDSFSEINDLYGSEVGDMVLIELGNILSELASIYNLNVYKLNADEFGVFIGVELNNFEQIFRDFADNLISKLNKKPFVYKEQEIHFTVTLGIATGKDRLIIKANKAYREAKIQKRHYAFYSENLINKSANNNLKWLRELKFAFERDNIKAYFQPIINNHTGKIEKYESLVRLVDSKNEVKSPYFFLDVAKKSKLYPKITQKMIELAIETFRDKPYEFSINLSVEDILNSETIDFFKSKLQDRELAKKVVLEIVESEGIENFTEVADFINEMKELGCKIAIDDFGTGYSNFQYLASLNVDLIKIDGSLIKNIDNDKTLEIITKTIIDFARELNIKTVAEFVHSQSVLDKVKELKIDYSQGFFLGEPSDKI